MERILNFIGNKTILVIKIDRVQYSLRTYILFATGIKFASRGAVLFPRAGHFIVY